MKELIRFLKDEEGASAVEYGLLVAGVAALIAVVVYILGGATRDKMQETADAINAAPGGGTGTGTGT